jgi:hypothetical protein
MNRSEIISAIKARLDELTPFQEGDVALDESVKPVEQYIDGFLDEATDTVRLISPAYRLEASEFPRDDEGNFTLEEDRLGDGVVYYKLAVPDDFLKIAEVRMANWERPCFSATLEAGESYRMLRNPYTTAGPTKPAVVVTGGNIELYGSRVGGVKLIVGNYIDKKYYDDDDAPDADVLVENAIIWRCALLVLGVMGRAEVLKQAEAFYVEAARLMVSN